MYHQKKVTFEILKYELPLNIEQQITVDDYRR